MRFLIMAIFLSLSFNTYGTSYCYDYRGGLRSLIELKEKFYACPIMNNQIETMEQKIVDLTNAIKDSNIFGRRYQLKSISKLNNLESYLETVSLEYSQEQCAAKLLPFFQQNVRPKVLATIEFCS